MASLANSLGIRVRERLRTRRSERGLIVLALLLGANGAVSLYSSAAGVSEADVFVHPNHAKLPKLKGKVRAYAALLPATQQFGYFAPQVCSEFRIKIRLADSRTGKIKDATFNLGSEGELLASSLNAGAQEEAPARGIAAAYAAHALDLDREYDYARADVQAEYLPTLKEARRSQPEWVTIRAFYFRR